MKEKERKRLRNLSLAQNILICLVYAFLLLCFLVLWAGVAGLFSAVSTQRQGEIDDVAGWGIIFESFAGVLGGFAVIVLGFVLLVFTVWQILMWLMFWKANRRTRPFSRRKPWGIADQIFKILAGAFGMRTAGEGLAELFCGERAGTADMTGVVLFAGASLFFLVTGIYLMVMFCRKREEISEDTAV